MGQDSKPGLHWPVMDSAYCTSLSVGMMVCCCKQFSQSSNHHMRMEVLYHSHHRLYKDHFLSLCKWHRKPCRRLWLMFRIKLLSQHIALTQLQVDRPSGNLRICTPHLCHSPACACMEIGLFPCRCTRSPLPWRMSCLWHPERRCRRDSLWNLDRRSWFEEYIMFIHSSPLQPRQVDPCTLVLMSYHTRSCRLDIIHFIEGDLARLKLMLSGSIKVVLISFQFI